jgi:hypothetical protein
MTRDMLEELNDRKLDVWNETKSRRLVEEKSRFDVPYQWKKVRRRQVGSPDFYDKAKGKVIL